jgi:hypothetical protein
MEGEPVERESSPKDHSLGEQLLSVKFLNPWTGVRLPTEEKKPQHSLRIWQRKLIEPF